MATATTNSLAYSPPRSLAAPSLTFDLEAEIAELRSAPHFRLERHNAKTLVKHPDLRLVLIALRAGARLEQHRTECRITVQTLEGSVQLHLPEQTVDVPAGSVLVLDKGIPHDVVAQDDSAFLLSMSGPAGAPQHSDELDHIAAEHARFAKLLAVLEQELGRFHRAEQPDYELLRDLFSYLTNYPDRFLHPKEDRVFAKLAERAPEAKVHVDELHRLHRIIRDTGASFLANMEEALNGTILPRAYVEQPGRAYLAMYREHMALEAEVLVPLARTHLLPEDWTQARAVVNDDEDPVFGGQIAERYRALHRQIARAAGCGCEAR